jgi:peptidyl-prolyl cis-trans isomerase B (cyclophilin B)
MRKVYFLFAVICLPFAFTAQAQESPAKAPAKINRRPAAPAPKKAPPAEPFANATVEEMSKQCVTFDTEAGEIVAEMFPEHAPETVRSFLNLAALEMLDTTVFSRVVKGFVVQGGDLSTSRKKTQALFERARKNIKDEPSEIKHERGILSMARGDEANSASTHFFFLVSDAPHLDGKFAAFGRVTSGMETVDAINKAEVKDEKPAKPVQIRTAKVAACARMS